MRTAQVRVIMTYWYEVKIYEYEYAIIPSPMLVYRIVLRNEELRTLPTLLLELGVNDVCIEKPIHPCYRKEYLTAKMVINPEPYHSGLVQSSFW